MADAATQKIETDEVSENEVSTEESNDETESESKLSKVREETITDLIEQRHEVKSAEYAEEDARITHKNAKNTREAKQEKMNRLVDQLDDIENGNYQTTLDFPADDESEPTEDQGKTTNIVDAADNGDFDITPSQCGKLLEAEIFTVADLEAAICQGKIQNISGLGQVAVDRISDAVLKFREEYPLPVEADDDDEPEAAPSEESECDAT